MGIFSIYRHHLQNAANRCIIATLDPPKQPLDLTPSPQDRDAAEIAKIDKKIAKLPPDHPDIKFLLGQRKIFEDGFYTIGGD